MPKFNTNAYLLKAPFDPLSGKNPDDYPEQTRFRDLHTISNPGPLPRVGGAINSALAGSRVSTTSRLRGGSFAPRATSGMS